MTNYFCDKPLMFDFLKKHPPSKEPGQTPVHREPPPPQSLPQPRVPMLGWLREIEPLEAEKGQGIPHQLPSLIIGLGHTGQVVLNQIKANYLERYQEGLPENLRLLFIESPQVPASPLLDRDEYIPWQHITIPEFSSLAKQPFFEWIQGSGSQPSGRQVARTQLIWDHLQIRSQSRLYGGLQACLRGWGGLDKPRIFFVANLAEPDSAFLWDVIYLLRNQAAKASGLDLRTSQFIALLAIASPSGSSGATSGESFAALRELSRFTYPLRSVFNYPDPDLDGIDSGPLVDYCFMIETHAHHQPATDLQSFGIEEGVGRVISESLLVFLDASAQTIDQSLRDVGSALSNERENLKQTFVSSLGIASIVLPVKELRQALELRLLRTILFGGEAGRPQEGFWPVPQASTSPRPPDLSAEEAYRVALDFLSQEQIRGTPNHHPAFRWLAEAVQNKAWRVKEKNWPVELDELFAAKLAEWMTEQLNGSGPDFFAARSNRLPCLLLCLDQVRKILDEAHLFAARSLSPTSLAGQALQERIGRWRETTEQAISELRAWEDALVGKKVDKVAQPRVSYRSKRDEIAPCLLALMEEDWLNTRAVLNALTQAPVRRALLEPGEDKPPYKGLEAPFYIKYIRPELGDPPGLPGEVLSRLTQRIGWLWRLETEGPRLFLIVPPSKFDGSLYADSLGATSQVLFRREQIPQVYERLRELASAYSRGVLAEKLEDWIERFGSEKTIAHLQKASEPLLPFERYRDGQKTPDVPPESSHHLVVHDPRLAEKIRQKTYPYLPQPMLRGKIDDNFPNPITLLSLHHKVVLEATDIYRKEEQRYTYQPFAHVFLAEQRAARAEKKAQMAQADFSSGERIYLHPSFIALLQIGDLADLFLRAWVYGLVEVDDKQGWRIQPLDGFESISGKANSLMDALEEFAITLPCSNLRPHNPLYFRNRGDYEIALAAANQNQAQQERANRKARFSQIEKEWIPLLHRQRDVRAKSLAAYLTYLLEEERFGSY